MTSAQLAFTITSPLLSSQISRPSTFWVTETRTASVFSPVSTVSGTEPVSTITSLTFPLSPSPSPSPTTPYRPVDSSIAPSKEPQVVTEVLTVTKTTTKTITPSPSSSTPSPSMTRATWSAPARMTDLSAFNVSSFHTGRDNLAIVQGIPRSASASLSPMMSTASPMALIDSSPSPTSTSSSSQPWDNSTSVLQLLYPANSINPGNRPVGGAQFYATPIEMASAQNVTLRYSAFFPADFDWVLAGKLPGLYGGRTGCSGGDEAEDCFSTRLMWRKGGSGELYLYAPKDKQTDELCAHPQSVCHSAYGLSVGRGSFKFARGAWTTVQQNVVLNTPGKQDGVFVLDVNGRRVIERRDVFYRDVPRLSHGNKKAKNKKPEKKKKKPKKKPKKPNPDGDLGDFLDPLLDGLFGRDAIWNREWDGGRRWDGFLLDDVDVAKGLWDVEVKTGLDLKAEGSSENDSDRGEVKRGKPVGFLGLFFSTFFGGHDPEYATPRDQYVWFKDFALFYNA